MPARFRRPFWSTSQVARELAIHPDTVRAWCDDGTLPNVIRFPNGYRRVPVQSVIKVLGSVPSA